MSTRLKIWLPSVLIYLSFFVWYTDMQGPLSDIEVEEFVATMTAAGNDPEEIAKIGRASCRERV